MLPASRVPPPSRRAPNWSSDESHTEEHHPQPTIPLPRLNRQAESRRQHPPEKPSNTHTPKPGFGGRGHEILNIVQTSNCQCISSKTTPSISISQRILAVFQLVDSKYTEMFRTLMTIYGSYFYFAHNVINVIPRTYAKFHPTTALKKFNVLPYPRRQLRILHCLSTVQYYVFQTNLLSKNMFQIYGVQH